MGWSKGSSRKQVATRWTRQSKRKQEVRRWTMGIRGSKGPPDGPKGGGGRWQQAVQLGLGNGKHSWVWKRQSREGREPRLLKGDQGKAGGYGLDNGEQGKIGGQGLDKC